MKERNEVGKGKKKIGCLRTAGDRKEFDKG